MRNPHIGLIIKQIIKEKDLDITQIAKNLGIARNTVYQVFGRTRMSDDDLERWAHALSVSTEDITSRQKMSEVSPNSQNEALHFGQEVAARIEAEMARMREVFERELVAKNRQIEKLIELLGKTEGSTFQAELGAMYEMAA